MESQEKLGEKKDEEISTLAAEAMKQLAKNVGLEFDKFMDELIRIRMKKKKE